MGKKPTDDPFVMHTRSMLESAARREMNLAEYQCLDVIEIELMRHGGKYEPSGGVPVDFLTFIKFGVHKNAVAPAIRGLVELGKIRVTKPGRGGNAEHREVAEYCLTYAPARDNVNNKVHPTNEWRKWEEAPENVERAVKEARARKDPRAVARGKLHAARRRLNPKTDQFSSNIKSAYSDWQREAPEIIVDDGDALKLASVVAS